MKNVQVHKNKEELRVIVRIDLWKKAEQRCEKVTLHTKDILSLPQLEKYDIVRCIKHSTVRNTRPEQLEGEWIFELRKKLKKKAVKKHVKKDKKEEG